MAINVAYLMMRDTLILAFTVLSNFCCAWKIKQKKLMTTGEVDIYMGGFLATAEQNTHDFPRLWNLSICLTFHTAQSTE